MANKTDLVSDVDIQVFLENHHNQSVNNLQKLSGGKHSEAFSYTHDNRDYVIRFNVSDRGFRKDQYVYQNFSGNGVVISEIYALGTFCIGIYYCISEKVHGETARQEYMKGDYRSLPLQFEMIEKIKGIKIPTEYAGFGEWEPDNFELNSSFLNYVQSIYTTKNLVDWNELSKLPYFNRDFTDYLFEKLNYYIQYSPDIRELLHGDFGNENLFLNNRKISGVIDWERSLYGDHFLDVGRVVLFCPNREATVTAALEYYRKNGAKNYKERIMMGVYFAMLRNYGLAARDGNEASCINSPKRIKEFERLMGGVGDT